MAKKSKSTEPVRSPRREAIGVILLALCLLSFLCVFSFNANDLGFLNDPPADPPNNLVGPFGAWFAGVGFMTFGIGGYLLPFVLLTGGLLMTLRSSKRIWPTWSWLAAAMIGFSSLFEYMSWGRVARLTHELNVGTAGGVLGNLLAVRTLGRWIGHAGAGIIFVTLLILALLQLTGMHPAAPFVFLWNQIKALMGRAKAKAGEKPKAAESTPAPAPAKLKKRERKEKAQELFTPPTPVSAAKPAAAPAPKPAPKPAAAPTPAAKPKPAPKSKSKPAEKDELSHVSINISPGVDESGYQLPPITLLNDLPNVSELKSKENTTEKSQILQATLEQFGVDGQVTHVESGPTVTSYEVTPAPGVRVNKIIALERDIARSMRAQSIRIQAPIPGKDAVGIEIPNTKSSPVFLRQLAESKAFHDPNVALPLALGTDVSGKMIVGDLAKMPHMLIAGATGAGKTVCMNSLLTGLMLSRTPDQMRMILVDPKTFEFQAYENLKHLVVPIITDAKKVTLGLRWAIKEMEKRYSLFKKVKVRDIKSFNERPVEKQEDMFGDDNPKPSDVPAKLPYIVIVVDELAELMGVAQQEIEPCIVRLAQLSRAAGIHMILATQRPSVNVITGTIKANIPGRIAFQVAQGNDSRTILDSIGAEKLLGNGDMLYLPPGKSKPVRLQGTWTKDEEMNRVTDFVREQGTPDFITEITEKIESNKPAMPEMDKENELLEAAIEVLRSTKRASTSSLQRRLRIGYNRAANLMDLLEEQGIIGPPTDTGPRDILIDLDGEIPDAPKIEEDVDLDLPDDDPIDLPTEPLIEKDDEDDY